MAIKTVCQTPDVIFSTSVNSQKINIELKLPFELNLSKSEAILLESNIHNALELVLARYFKVK